MSIMFAILSVLNSLLLQSSHEKEVRDLDARLNRFIMKNDSSNASSFYSKDFMLITSKGKVKSRQNILFEIASPQLKMEINETSDVRIRVHGSTAVLTGILHQKGSYNGTPFDARLRVTDTWIHTFDGWKILSGHACEI